jgi:arsenate reductase
MIKNIFVLCTGNSCRSQIAEGFIRHYYGNEVTVYSAGIETHGVNPKAIATMAEVGIDISKHTSNHVDAYLDIPFDLIITVCDHAAEQCPVFPSLAQRVHRNFPDPAKAQGSNEDIEASFRSTRDRIDLFCREELKGILS